MLYFKFKILFLFFFILYVNLIHCSSKYSKETKLKEKPFRIQKINVLWEKAQNRLSSKKLKSLFKDLKEQDKNEIALKKLNAEGLNKEGLKSLEVKSKLNSILSKYELNNIFENVIDDNSIGDIHLEEDHYLNKRIFKDKNLDKLWKKAEKGHFTDEELKILKEEFQHHEKKLDEYHNLIDKVNNLEDKKKFDLENWENSIERHHDEEPKLNENNLYLQSVKTKHKEVKNNFNNLKEKISKNVKIENREFEEDEVEKLWKLAMKSNFDKIELQLLREELNHFHQRIKKLNYFHEELSSDYFNKKYEKEDLNDLEINKSLKNRVRDLTQQVDKLRTDIEAKILQRHIEL